MSEPLPLTTSDPPGTPPPGAVPPRFPRLEKSRLFVVLCVGAALALTTAVIAGAELPAVLQATLQGAMVLPLLLAATMVGLALTAPAARAGALETLGLPWPAGFRLVLAAAAGLGTLALAILALGTLHLISATAILILLAFAAAAGIPETLRFFRTRPFGVLRLAARRGDWLALAAAVPLATLLIAATFPPSTLWRSEFQGYDVLEYHLEMPREYAQAGNTAPVSHNVYSVFPSNIEMLYLGQLEVSMAVGGVGPDRGGFLLGVLACQFLHAAITLLAAGAILLGPWPGRVGGVGRVAAAAAFLAFPWTLVTGSLAYNDGGPMLFGGLALLLAMAPGRGQSVSARRHVWVIIGVLLGLAVGCKLTAGLFFAIPVAVIMLAGREIGRRLRRVTFVAGVAVAAFAPWGLRAAIYSGGNPVFPVAATWLPRDGWDSGLAERFARGHGPPPTATTWGARLALLGDQWFLDPQWSPGLARFSQWAAIAGQRPEAAPPTAAWQRIGPWWLLLALAAAATIRRREGLLLMGVLAMQVLMWLGLTHLQSRFLLPTAVPMALLAGLAIGGSWRPIRWACGLLLVGQAAAAGLLLLGEARLLGGIVGPHPENAPAATIGQVVTRRLDLDELLGHAGSPREPVASPSRVLLVGAATPLYLVNPAIYNTGFDRSPLAETLRAGGVPAAIAWMRREGVRYVWFDAGELRRLGNSYGIDGMITPELESRLVAGGLKETGWGIGADIHVLEVPVAAGGTISERP